MKYILMCGGNYTKWETPRQLTKIKNDETLVERTIRLLKENGVDDIAITTNNPAFDFLKDKVEIIHHNNDFEVSTVIKGSYMDAFYLMDTPVTYIFGDVLFSEEAIRTIVQKETRNIDFFASKPPFSSLYIKPWVNN